MLDRLKLKTFVQEPLHFDELETIEGETRYYKTPYGNMPSMTSMLKLLDDGGLKQWVNRVGKEEADKICKQASSRGNSLHELSELYLQNKLTREVKSKHKANFMFDKSKPFLDRITKVHAIEVPLYSRKLQYAGRVDAIVTLEYNGKEYLTILDHKNSRNAIDTKKQYARRKLWRYMLQCTGYKYALEEMKGISATKGALIVANYNEMYSEPFVFNINKFEKEFELLVDAYYNKRDIKESAFWRL